MAPHASTWADRWVERTTEEDGSVTTDYAEALDCDTCGRTFIGHGPTTTDAMQDASAMHDEHAGI